MTLPLWFWIYLWKAVLIGGMVLFGTMAVWVTIGGASDIKKLFATLAEQQKQNDQE